MGQVERWRDIPGYDGWYQISTEGRVRSYRAYGPGNRLEEPRELHPRLRNTSHGPYLVVALKVDAKTQRTHTMTRLMAETWMKNLGSERGRQWRRGTESPTAKSSPW